MTEPTPEPETPPEPQPAPDDEPMTVSEARKLRRESASLRARLHEAEEQLGAAAAVLSAYQLNEVRRIAGETLVDPDDLITRQPDMSAYIDEQFAGLVNADRVTEQAKALIAQRPHLAKPSAGPPPTDRPIEGLRSGTRPEEPPPGGHGGDA
jgi:hypothetical protein